MFGCLNASESVALSATSNQPSTNQVDAEDVEISTLLFLLTCADVHPIQQLPDSSRTRLID